MRNDVISQELKDFKEEIKSRLEDIQMKVTWTNGKVAQAITDIELSKSDRDNIKKDLVSHIDECPAKSGLKDLKETLEKNRDWSAKRATIIISLIALATTIINVMLSHLKI